MTARPSREELYEKLRSLRKAVVAGSIVAFLVALGLVATNPVGTQASTQTPPAQNGDEAAPQDQPQQQPARGFPGSGYQNPVTNAPYNQPPLLHSRRS